MIAKLVTYGEDRLCAVKRWQALDDYYIRRATQYQVFECIDGIIRDSLEGRLTTNFIAEEYPDGFDSSHVPQDDPAKYIVVTACVPQPYRPCLQIERSDTGLERKHSEAWVVTDRRISHAVNVWPIEDGYEGGVRRQAYKVVTDWDIREPLLNCD